MRVGASRSTAGSSVAPGGQNRVRSWEWGSPEPPATNSRLPKQKAWVRVKMGLSEGMASDTSRGKSPAESKTSLLSTLPTKDIPASFLKQITNDYSPERELGTGAFGTVYKGILGDGEVIAVKKLRENSPIAQDKTFKNEVGNLMAAQHENIVKLVGFCHETHKKVVEHSGKYIIVDVAEILLCYEYLPKGSLDKHIFTEPSRTDWDTRFKLIKGICNGLHFLHNEMDGPVVHMDLKPDNILLDDHMVPKIADFGLSRLFGQDQTRMNTLNIVGAFGYMAPEYLYRGEISTQADIYSLGLLIIQISTGENNIPNVKDKCGEKFIEKVQKIWTELHITSKYASFGPDPLKQIKACIEIGLQCVEHERKKRPSIVKIVEKLNENILFIAVTPF
ncbi:putative receptor-like protein kinase [Dichanthelium oligosanthes]|uniref:Putative receptor-like protein kinase n=1 Tax=Dichanthelium oligosanthes TaxID=888268 RepID=A0A1E5UQI7_9POAL|nr:putative receptor-like protein kinase [Dichanthelium oligosanthes]